MTRLAALRIDEAGIARLENLVAQIESCTVGDGDRLQDLDLALFHAIAGASENLAFLLVLNSVSAAYGQYRELFTAVYERRIADGGRIYRRIVKAIAKGQDKAAARNCRQLLAELATLFPEAQPAA